MTETALEMISQEDVAPPTPVSAAAFLTALSALARSTTLLTAVCPVTTASVPVSMLPAAPLALTTLTLIYGLYAPKTTPPASPPAFSLAAPPTLSALQPAVTLTRSVHRRPRLCPRFNLQPARAKTPETVPLL